MEYWLRSQNEYSFICNHLGRVNGSLMDSLQLDDDSNTSYLLNGLLSHFASYLLTKYTLPLNLVCLGSWTIFKQEFGNKPKLIFIAFIIIVLCLLLEWIVDCYYCVGTTENISSY